MTRRLLNMHTEVLVAAQLCTTAQIQCKFRTRLWCTVLLLCSSLCVRIPSLPDMESEWTPFTSLHPFEALHDLRIAARLSRLAASRGIEAVRMGSMN